MAKNSSPKRRGVSEESMSNASDMNSGFTNKFKIEEQKQRFLITFPIITESGDPAVKTIEHFACDYQKTLSDGKWHSFQMPEDDDVYEACLKHPALSLTKTRFALALVYETDTRGKPKGSKNIGYYYAWVKVSDYVKNSLIEVWEDSNDDLKGADIQIKLSAAKNALKMQDMQYTLSAKRGLAKANKCSQKFIAMQKEAKEIWKTLEDRVVRIEEDDTILALIDDYGSDDEDEPRPKKKSSTRKRKFNKKDL